jgi:TP901 family phage tail tape measure protein
MAGRFSVEAVFKAVDRITAPVSRIQNRVGKMTRSIGRGFDRLNRKVNKVGGSLKGMARRSAVALAGLALVLANVTNVGADFGRAIGSAAVKFPEQIQRGTEEFKALEVAARDVGRTTEFTSVQAARGLNFLAKAGFDAAFSMKALKPIVDFATASEIEFAEAADIASDTLGAFGLNAKDPIKKLANLTRVMDVMSATANSTNTSVAELFEAVKGGAAITDVAGGSIETFSAIMGFLANSGIKATKAATASKNITLALAGVGNKAAKSFRRLGISLQDLKGDLRDPLSVLDDLRGRLKGFGTKQKVGILEAIFGKISLASAAKLIGDAGTEVRELRLELNKAGGSSKRTAAFIRDDVRGSIDGLTSAIEGVKISIFSLNEGPLKEVIDRMTEWVRANETLIGSKIGGFLLGIINNLDTIVTWVKRISIALAVFVALTAVLKTLALVLTVVNLLMAANPVVLITLAIIALIAAIASVITWWRELKEFIVGLPTSVIAAWALLTGPIGWLIGASALIMKHWEPIKDFFKGIADSIAEVINTIKSSGSILGRGLKLASGLFSSDEDETESLDGFEPRMKERRPQMVSPHDRTGRSIDEQRTVSKSEVTIKAPVGVAEVTKGKLGSGLRLQDSGAF